MVSNGMTLISTFPKRDMPSCRNALVKDPRCSIVGDACNLFYRDSFLSNSNLKALTFYKLNTCVNTRISHDDLMQMGSTARSKFSFHLLFSG